jgi:hypothetical protein
MPPWQWLLKRITPILVDQPEYVAKFHIWDATVAGQDGRVALTLPGHDKFKGASDGL